MTAGFRFYTVIDEMRRETRDGPPGLFRDGRFNRSAIMRRAVSEARKAAVLFGGSWQKRMGDALRVAWFYAKKQAQAAASLPAPIIQPAQIMAPVRTTVRPYGRLAPYFQRGSRAFSHGW